MVKKHIKRDKNEPADFYEFRVRALAVIDTRIEAWSKVFDEDKDDNSKERISIRIYELSVIRNQIESLKWLIRN